MSTKLSIRLDEELQKMIEQIKQTSSYNLSEIMRAAIKQGFKSVDNNELSHPVEKDEENSCVKI